MTGTIKRMKMEEIVNFINKMPDNSYAKIAKPVVDKNGKVIDYDYTGWWSFAKVSYADSTTLIFNCQDGSIPYSYPIDCNYEDETPENAVKRFLCCCKDFGMTDGYFIIDTEIRNLYSDNVSAEKRTAKKTESDSETAFPEETPDFLNDFEPIEAFFLDELPDFIEECPDIESKKTSVSDKKHKSEISDKKQKSKKNELCDKKLVKHNEIEMIAEMCKDALKKAGIKEKEAEDFVTSVLRNEFYSAVGKKQINNIKMALLNSTFDKIYGDDK